MSVRLVCHKFEQKKESVVSTSLEIWCVRKMAQNLVDSFFVRDEDVGDDRRAALNTKVIFKAHRYEL